MAGVLDAVSRWRKVEEATSATDTAPPIYLMDELAELASADAEQAESIADHVNKRLKQSSPVVKWKALRLVRHLCNKGCYSYQRCMQRHAASIRELVHYQGEKDPFKGDSLNQRVRESAKETIEVLYSSASPPATSFTQPTAPKGRIQGFGSSSSAAPPQATGTDAFATYTARPTTYAQQSSGRMVGFGSDGRTHTMQPATSAPTTDLANTVTSAVSSLGSLIRSQLPLGNKEHTSALHQRSGSHGDSGYVGFGISDNAPRASGLGSASLRSQPISVNAVMGSEEQLVDDICAAVGIRAAPDPEDLRKFVELASNMDGLRIGELLISKMSSPSWQVVLRALYALEAVLQRGSSQACGEVAVMFQSDPSPVTRAQSSPQPTVREHASRCLKLLLNEDTADMPVSDAAQVTAKPIAAGPAPPLMDFGGDADEATTQPAAPATAPIDLLGALDGSLCAVPAAQPFSQATLTQPSGLHTTQSTSSRSDPFGGLDGSSLQLSPATLPAGQSAAAPSLLGVQATGPAPAVAAATGPLDDFFASLSVSGSQQPQHLPYTSHAAATGSSQMISGMPDSHTAGSVLMAHQQKQPGTAGLGMLGGHVGMNGASASLGMGLHSIGINASGAASGMQWGMPSSQTWSMPLSQNTAPAASWQALPAQQPAGQQLQSKASDAAFDFVKDILK